jgi:enoyl-CoA hydratase/carnithine racemase
VELVADDRLLARALEMARTLAAQPLESLVETKRLLNAPHREQFIASVKAENEAVMRLKEAPAYREAVAAFRARRAPDGRGWR